MSDVIEIDVTSLVEYTGKIREIGSFNKMMAANYLRDFIEAMDLTSGLLASAIKDDLEAKSNLDTHESIAFLDRAKAYLVERDIKDTAEARKRYVNIDEDVIEARQHKAKTEALVVFLKNKFVVFKCAHDDVKKITYGDDRLTNYGGM